MQPARQPVIARIGPFEVDIEAGELRKHGMRIKLQAQPLKVLVMLLESKGSVVSREELRHHLWPDDTFVDFERGLNAAVAKLRQALGDSAEVPRYIETLAKRGYRLLIPVEYPIYAPIVQEPLAPTKRNNLALAGIILLLVAALGSGLYFTRSKAVGVLQPVPLTSFPGLESDPALSPDGNYVVFTWNGENQDNFDVYIMPVGSGVPRRLTIDPAPDFSPAWSPDGRMIAFLRGSQDKSAEIIVIPANGGPEHTVAVTKNSELRSRPPRLRLSSLAWSPDGHWLATANREGDELSDGIYFFSLTGDKRRVTSPPLKLYGDYMPAFSPDGHTLAFCRLVGFSASEIYLLPLEGNLRPAGDARVVTEHKGWSVNPMWMTGKRLLYLFSRAPESPGEHELRAIFVDRHPGSERAIPLADQVFQASAGRNLVYSRFSQDIDVWRAKIPSKIEGPVTAKRFLSSTRLDMFARYSPDGRAISFVSERSGFPEVWIAAADGSNPARMTSFNGPLVGPPAWSPDGQSLIFHARPEGQSDLFVIPAAGGPMQQLTRSAWDEVMPVYSRNGRWIYFDSLRSGQLQIWKMPAKGGAGVQMTTRGGSRAVESPDEKFLYYASDENKSIWRMPVSGGVETQIVAPVHESPFGFAVTGKGIYYPAPPNRSNQRYIRYFSFNLFTRNTRAIVQAAMPFHYTLEVSPDEKYILFDQLEPQMDLMLVEKFQPPL